MADDEGGGKRRSNAVILSLIGVAGVWVVAAEANPSVEMRRNLYPDRSACERDYSPQQCEPQNSTTSSGGGGHGGASGGSYRGPSYVANGNAPAGDPGSGRTRTAFLRSYESSFRGGFGAFGRATRAVA